MVALGQKRHDDRPGVKAGLSRQADIFRALAASLKLAAARIASI
jgi:hypothetical protein